MEKESSPQHFSRGVLYETWQWHGLWMKFEYQFRSSIQSTRHEMIGHTLVTGISISYLLIFHLSIKG